MNGRESIPIDLIIEILSNLPLKTIARFRCVSQLWASSLCRSSFTELFLTRSSAWSHLLFAVKRNPNFTVNEWHFYSSTQPQNPDENSVEL
ncbi:hypothetical protein EUTSA_v10015410mg [Eutrema salsugineum]|uniref:F-box domain-containing protein n=1 Tax=Eutrema salsugineum TaxID=72664 RepID=V4LME0_EUTSA|nr:hypothetical protein EUTSA_v10015410mg [Eutrema salsugineum]